MEQGRPKIRAPSVRSLRQQVMEELRNAIQEGRIQPGERLIEAELATDLDVSRGCVREALRGLEREGLVVSLPYRETRVATTTEEEVIEVLVPIRTVIEIFAARQLVGRLRPEQIATLEQLIVAMRTASGAKDLRQLTHLDMEFHRQLISFADHPAIHAMWAGIDARVRGKFLFDTLASEPEAIVTIHESLLAALHDGSPDTIGDAVVTHIYGALPRRVVPTIVSASIRALATLLDREPPLERSSSVGLHAGTPVGQSTIDGEVMTNE